VCHGRGRLCVTEGGGLCVTEGVDCVSRKGWAVCHGRENNMYRKCLLQSANQKDLK
jgi:hypothetical protein